MLLNSASMGISIGAAVGALVWKDAASDARCMNAWPIKQT